MKIINQTKDKILRFNKIDIVCRVRNEIRLRNREGMPDEDRLLGIYKSEERVKEIFAQISLALIRKTKVFEMPEE